MTREAVYIYDSQFSYPFHYFANLHLNDLTCISWTPNGDILVISSIEGYNTFLTIDLETVGMKYTKPLFLTYNSQNENGNEENEEPVYPDSPKLVKPLVKRTPKKTKEMKKEVEETVNILTPRSKIQKSLPDFFKK